MLVIMDMASGERMVDDPHREPAAPTEPPRQMLPLAPRLALHEVSRDTSPRPVWGDPAPEPLRPLPRIFRH